MKMNVMKLFSVVLSTTLFIVSARILIRFKRIYTLKMFVRFLLCIKKPHIFFSTAFEIISAYHHERSFIYIVV